jgi:hypothetical protein
LTDEKQLYQTNIAQKYALRNVFTGQMNDERNELAWGILKKRCCFSPEREVMLKTIRALPSKNAGLKGSRPCSSFLTFLLLRN